MLNKDLINKTSHPKLTKALPVPFPLFWCVWMLAHLLEGWLVSSWGQGFLVPGVVQHAWCCCSGSICYLQNRGSALEP